MKKFYLFLIATCLSLSSLFAQALVAEQGMKSIPDVNVVGGRNNAPQASYSYHFSFDEDGTIFGCLYLIPVRCRCSIRCPINHPLAKLIMVR